MVFNANEHLTTLKGKDYLEVKWRIAWFRDLHPHGRISTTLLQLDMEKGMAVFKACIEDGENGYAEGHGSETAKDFGDYIEKAETKSIGRALAALGYGSQFAPEMEEGTRIVDSPVDHAPRTPENGPQKPQDTDLMKLLGDVKKLAQERGIADRPAWQMFVAETLKTYVPEDKLTKGQILTLRGEAIKRKKAS